MWYYKQTETNPTLYTVGCDDLNGDWHPDEDFNNRNEARDRVNYLNGGYIIKTNNNYAGYSIFLMIELCKAYNLLSRDLEYDLIWDLGVKLFAQYNTSSFNKSEESEYNCIERFIKHKIKIDQ